MKITNDKRRQDTQINTHFQVLEFKLSGCLTVQSNLQIQWNFLQITDSVVHINKVITKFTGKCQRPWAAEAEGLTTESSYVVTVTMTDCSHAAKGLRIGTDPHTYSQLMLNKALKTHTGERPAPSTNRTIPSTTTHKMDWGQTPQEMIPWMRFLKITGNKVDKSHNPKPSTSATPGIQGT